MGTCCKRTYRFILCLDAESNAPTADEWEHAPVIFGEWGGSQLDYHAPELTARKVLH